VSSHYRGASVSSEFMRRWRSKKHVAGSAPWGQVLVRRGRFARTYHWDWPNPQFGQIYGRSIRYQWYPDWTPLEDWIELPGVAQIDLDQSFDKNGITVATIDVDNVAWTTLTGVDGRPYHVRQRGYLWPWRGWVPPHRPGSGEKQNEWYRHLPNAQVMVMQGYGPDTAIPTFTGLIDNLSASVRPDRMTLTARDFGGVLVDTEVFGWNKDKAINAPICFIHRDYFEDEAVGLRPKDPASQQKYVVVDDAVDIIQCALRWCGFKEWEVKESGVNLKSAYQVDLGKTWADVITDVCTQLGYVFFIAEPSSQDSIGMPICRPSASTIPKWSQPITIRDNDLLTDLKPVHDNTDDRYIIRVRGKLEKPKNGGRALGNDPARVCFTYWPPWMTRMAGVIKQLTFYNIGDSNTLPYTTVKECMVAAVLIAIQIALARDTATAQCPGIPALGLDSFAYIIDAGTGVTSRLYLTNRKSTMQLGGDGTEQASSGYSGGAAGGGSSDLRWATEFGGSLVDNKEFDQLVKDYNTAVSGGRVLTHGTPD
jgi:hypothetical protein